MGPSIPKSNNGAPPLMPDIPDLRMDGGPRPLHHQVQRIMKLGEMMLTRTSHRRVLIVDDDENVRYVLRLILEVDDFEVVGEATDGVEAVPQAVSLRPDFIVLDQQMPNRDGQATAEMIRELVPDAQIIAFSAILERKPAWADAYLAKQNISDVAPLVEGLIDLRDH